MRIARCVLDSEPFYALVEGEEVAVISGDPFFHGVQTTGTRHALEDVRLVAPIIPRSKVIGFGDNYLSEGDEAPVGAREPLMFLKPNTSVVGPGEPVRLPSFSDQVAFEGELAVVIGRICKDVPVEDADAVIFGYTCANDLTALEAQRTDGQWARAKGWDGSCPLGPWIETELDPENLSLVTSLDGEVTQDDSTSNMRHGVRQLVAQASAAFTLLPGDVILTGTPAGVGLVEDGQRVSVTIEGIGTLTNVFTRD